MIPYTDFVHLLADTKKYDQFEAYAAECGGSVPVDNTYRAVALLTQIWALGHNGLSIDSILQVAEISMARLTQNYRVPYRTVQNWKLETRKPPEWLLPMMAYAVLSDVNSET